MNPVRIKVVGMGRNCVISVLKPEHFLRFLYRLCSIIGNQGDISDRNRQFNKHNCIVNACVFNLWILRYFLIRNSMFAFIRNAISILIRCIPVLFQTIHLYFSNCECVRMSFFIREIGKRSTCPNGSNQPAYSH